MAGTAYNLKKYLKFSAKKAQSKAGEVIACLIVFFECITVKNRRFEPFIY
jgi:hypothetical protein